MVTCHVVVVLGDEESEEVEEDREGDTNDNSDCHDLSKEVEDGVEWENTSEVENKSNDIGCVEGRHSITEVWQLLPLKVLEWLTLGPNTWKNVVESNLDGSKCQEDSPSTGTWDTMVKENLVKVLNKVLEGLTRSWGGELAIVELSRDPHVPHEKREPDHHAEGTRGTTKLVLDLSLQVSAIVSSHCVLTCGLGRIQSSDASFVVVAIKQTTGSRGTRTFLYPRTSGALISISAFPARLGARDFLCLPKRCGTRLRVVHIVCHPERFYYAST